MSFLKLIVFFLIFLFPFGQLTRLPNFLSPQIHLYFQDLLLAILIIFWLGHHLLRQKPFPIPPLSKPIFLFSGIALFSLINNDLRLNFPEIIISSLYLLRWLAFASLYFIGYEIIEPYGQSPWFLSQRPDGANIPYQKTNSSTGRTRGFLGTGIKLNKRNIVISQYRNIVSLLIKAGLLTAIFGLLQYLLYPNLRNLSYLDWDPHENRLFGTFLDPNFTGIILALTLILLTSRQFDKLNLPSLFLHPAWLLTYLALILTYSRSSYLAYLAGMLILGLIRKSWKFPLIIFIVFSISLLLLPRPPSEGVKLERVSTINARLQNYQETLTIIKDHPLFGIGFNSLRYAKRDYGFLEEKDWQERHSGAGSDSSFLFVLATTGIFGFAAYLWLLLRISRISNFEFRISPSKLPITALSSLTALLVHSLFLNSLFYPHVMLWFWLLLGVTHASLNNSLIPRRI